MTSEIRFKCDLCKVPIAKEDEDHALTILETEGCLRKTSKGAMLMGLKFVRIAKTLFVRKT